MKIPLYFWKRAVEAADILFEFTIEFGHAWNVHMEFFMETIENVFG
jgi:poly-beta-hydroxyalkanoate depolymerase